MAFYDYDCSACGKFEVQQSMHDDIFKTCPRCGGTEIRRLISLPSACITGGKQMNQFNDCKGVKYWRDQNGIRHKITASDGHYKAASTGKRVTASPEEIKRRKNAR